MSTGGDATGTARAAQASACPACGGATTHPFGHDGGRFHVVVCDRCGLGRTVPQPSDAELRALYAGDYQSADARKFSSRVERARRFFARALVRRIVRRAGRGGRALDVGCGDGKLLTALIAQGYEGTGTELNPRIGETAPKGATIVVGTLEDAHLPAHSQRVVVMRHVLEHVRDPRGTVRELRRVIADDGCLVIGVPNLASWQARVARERWFHLDLPRHLFHFTPASLTMLLESEGFRIERVSHLSFDQNPYGWLQSALNMLGGRWAGLYDQLRSEGARNARALDPMAAALGALITPLSVVLTGIEAAAHAGGTVEVWARPR